MDLFYRGWKNSYIMDNFQVPNEHYPDVSFTSLVMAPFWKSSSHSRVSEVRLNCLFLVLLMVFKPLFLLQV